MTFISYSQNLEDVMLWRALRHIEKGFYVDVGANDPVLLSVTNAFYQRGWHGINIDPVTYELLCLERTRDINLKVAAGAVEGEIEFYEVPNSALCTSDVEVANRYRRSGQAVVEKKVAALTLNQILQKYAEPTIHFMNIDVEGAELQVLKGINFSLWRPWIVLLEATIPTTAIPSFQEWEPLIISSGYRFAYFDGLNRYYVAKEHGDLLDAFRIPPNIFDHYVLSTYIENLNELEAKEKVIQAQKAELEAKDQLIRLQERMLNKEKIIARLEDELARKEKDVERFREEVQNANRDFENKLSEKEVVIQGFKRSYVYWIVNGPFHWLPKLRPATFYLRGFLSTFLPKLGVLAQHPPKPLNIPKGYIKKYSDESEKAHVISIVTPSYNQVAFIERTIRSVVEQDYKNLEYVIQDGGSLDGTMQVVTPFVPRLKHFESHKDDGQAHAINQGFKYTSGDIMAYLNSDDILLPGALGYVADYFYHHPDVDVVYSHRIIVNENDEEIGRWVLPPHDGKVILWADYFPQETLFWRRSLWNKVGGKMNESFQFALDWELILRFRLVGANFVRVPRFLGAFRVHTSQKTSTQINEAGLTEMNRLRKQIHGREIDWEEINKNIGPYLRRSIIFHKMYRLGILRY